MTTHARSSLLAAGLLCIMLVSVILLPRIAAPTGMRPATSGNEGPLIPASPSLATGATGEASRATIGRAGVPVGRLHPPADHEVERRLRASGAIAADATAEEIARDVDAWRAAVAAANPAWWDAGDTARLVANERRVLAQAATARVPVTAHVLAIPVEFAGSETLTFQEQNAEQVCVTVTRAFTGPLHGRIPYPGGSVTETIDNQTVYYPSTEPEDYARLIFGREGYTQPLRAGDPNVNDGAGVDIAGLTVQTYFDAQSDGTVAITGTVAPWVQNPHAEAYYGIDRCVSRRPPRMLPDDQLGQLGELAVSAAEALKASGGAYGSYDFWRQFDADGDGMVDALWLIHAGRGQEYGGGSEGEAAIWSRANHVGAYEGYPEDGYVIHDNGTAAPEDDIRIGPFTEVPEDSDIGVLIEEFGHSFFGLPDLYTNNPANSVGWWAPMSAGIYGGDLGGTRPVNMPLWFRMIAACGEGPCGWADPVSTLPYTTPSEIVVIGQAGTPAGGTVDAGPHVGATIHEGVRIDLPDQTLLVPNRAGEGGGVFSGALVGEPSVLSHEVDLTAATAPLTLTLDAWWSMRAHAAFGHVIVATGAEDAATLPDLDGKTTAENRYGINRGNGLTGEGSGPLRFDLSAYAGQAITLTFLFQDWLGPSTGWWIDHVRIPGALEEDFESGLGGWINEGWTAVPFTQRFPHYYLVEWRNADGFDKSLQGAYAVTYSDNDELRVSRVSANVPGAVVWYRNTKYPFSGSLVLSQNDLPSIGPKYGLLVVDTDYWPTRLPSGRTLPVSLESLNAPLALGRQPDFSLELRDPMTRALLSTESITGTAGVTNFLDARGYVPGFFQDPAQPAATPAPLGPGLSVVIPSLDGDIYSTRITGPDRSRPHPLDGTTAAADGHYYGTGNPGDANLQYGVRIELVDQADDGRWGAVRIVNKAVDFEVGASAERWFPGQTLRIMKRVTNRGSEMTGISHLLWQRAPGGASFTAAAGSEDVVAPGETATGAYVLTVPADWPATATDDHRLVFRAEFSESPIDGDRWPSDAEVWTREVVLEPPLRVFLPALKREAVR